MLSSPTTNAGRGSGQARKPRARTGRNNGVQISANGPKMTFLVDDRPSLADLNLPGPRRERENRGGAHANLDVLRYLIRCPLLPAFTKTIAPRAGRPAAYPDLFWTFFNSAIRQFASAEQLIEELRCNWTEVCKEFFFEHGIGLPITPSVAYSSFTSWRTNAVTNREQQLYLLLERFTDVSTPLALTIRRAEGGDQPRDLLEPAVWDVIAADATVRGAPSDVREQQIVDENGDTQTVFPGSRAKTPGSERVHSSLTKNGKRSGPDEGQYEVAVTTKGTARYTRTVLGVDISEPGEAEITAAMRTSHRVYRRLGHQMPVLVYDGQMTPGSWQELMAAYGVFCVNANHARSRRVSTVAAESRAQDFDPDSDVTGEGQHRFGAKRGKRKRTYVSALPSVECVHGGTPHVHHLAADDGAVYEVAQPVLEGGPLQRLRVVAPSALERRRAADGDYYFKLALSGSCTHGGHFSFVVDLEKTRPNRHGNVGWRERIANVRIIPDAVLRYAEVMGHRNQVESFFSWLEKCYYHHDRSASWRRDAQIFDLLGAALLHNAEAWAHLAYRHPEEAERLAEDLAALAAPDLSGVFKKRGTESTKGTKSDGEPRSEGEAAPVTTAGASLVADQGGAIEDVA